MLVTLSMTLNGKFAVLLHWFFRPRNQPLHSFTASTRFEIGLAGILQHKLLNSTND